MPLGVDLRREFRADAPMAYFTACLETRSAEGQDGARERNTALGSVPPQEEGYDIGGPPFSKGKPYEATADVTNNIGGRLEPDENNMGIFSAARVARRTDRARCHRPDRVHQAMWPQPVRRSCCFGGIRPAAIGAAAMRGRLHRPLSVLIPPRHGR